VRQALHHYMDERIWKRIQLNGMAKDFFVEDACGGVCEAVRAARAARGISSARKVQERPLRAPDTGPRDGQNQQASEKGVRNKSLLEHLIK